MIVLMPHRTGWQTPCGVFILENEVMNVSIPLSKLMEDISRSVQNSNFLLEQMASEMYLQNGYQKNLVHGENGTDFANGAKEVLVPVTYSIRLNAPGENKELKVPATALMHHSTMQLEQVDVTLRFSVSGETGDQGILVDVKSKLLENSDKISEMKLHYQRDSASEGIARVENRHYQNL